MVYLACTRFNNTTYDENIYYRKKYNETVIYGSTLKIRESYPIDSLIFVAEMNNEKNRIEGIGLIKIMLVHDKRHRIYENNEYNRYIYRGKYWLSREQINASDPEILEIFDTVLFKGKSHLKCRIGITVISEKLFVHWIYDLQILKNKVKQVFIRNFKGSSPTETKLDNNFDDKELDEEKEDTIYIDIIPKKRRKQNILINI